MARTRSRKDLKVQLSKEEILHAVAPYWEEHAEPVSFRTDQKALHAWVRNVCYSLFQKKYTNPMTLTVLQLG